MSQFFAKRFQTLTPYTPGEQPADMEQFIKLNTNESPYAPSPQVFAAMDRGAIGDLRLYSDPTCQQFLKALAGEFGVDENMVMAGSGSDELLGYAFAAFGQNGVAFPNITYGFYSVLTDLFALEVQKVPLNCDCSVKISAYEGKKGMVVLANPNAPTGIYLPLDDVETLLQQDENRLVLIDEAYVDFGSESAVCLLKTYKNLVVIGTFSKSRNLAGARLGYAVANAELIAELNTLKFSFDPYNVNTLTLLAGAAALADKRYFTACTQSIIETREFVCNELKSMGFEMTKSAANFVFCAPLSPLSAQVYYKKLRENGILVRWFDTPEISHYVRITIGTKKQMEEVLGVTKMILDEKAL